MNQYRCRHKHCLKCGAAEGRADADHDAMVLRGLAEAEGISITALIRGFDKRIAAIQQQIADAK